MSHASRTTPRESRDTFRSTTPKPKSRSRVRAGGRAEGAIEQTGTMSVEQVRTIARAKVTGPSATLVLGVPEAPPPEGGAIDGSAAERLTSHLILGASWASLAARADDPEKREELAAQARGELEAGLALAAAVDRAELERGIVDGDAGARVTWLVERLSYVLGWLEELA